MPKRMPNVRLYGRCPRRAPVRFFVGKGLSIAGNGDDDSWHPQRQSYKAHTVCPEGCGTATGKKAGRTQWADEPFNARVGSSAKTQSSIKQTDRRRTSSDRPRSAGAVAS